MRFRRRFFSWHGDYIALAILVSFLLGAAYGVGTVKGARDERRVMVSECAERYERAVIAASVKGFRVTRVSAPCVEGR